MIDDKVYVYNISGSSSYKVNLKKEINKNCSGTL